jgi:hypothetical protein
MSLLTCPDVEARIELYAADECPPPEAAAIRRHLVGCPRCAAACDEARQLVGLLDLRLQEPERLRRLEDRIAEEAEPRPRVLRFPAALRRVAALAAMLIFTVGPVGWLMQGLTVAEGSGGLVVALDDVRARGGQEAMLAPGIDRAPEAMKGSLDQVRSQLEKAKVTGELPPPPEVDVNLELRNTTQRPMRVWVEGPPSELRLELRGPGARSVPAKETAQPKSRAVTIPPGKSEPIHITRLTDSQRSWYWTEPGDYTLTAEFSTVATIPGLGERRVTARSEPKTIHVPAK